MHKSKPSKHNLVLDRQKAKEFLEKRKQLRDRRTAPNNVRGGNNGELVYSTGRKMENDDV
jgi:hypothetical protein